MEGRRLRFLARVLRLAVGPALVLAAFFLPAGPVQAAPGRILSLNLCTDQLLVLLVPPERIAALSFLSRDPELSYVADRAATLPVVKGQAEEVLELAPDLVLAGTYTTRPTVALVKARGIPVLELDLVPGDFDDIRALVRQVAAAVGEVGRGEILLADMDGKLAEAAPADGRRPVALTLAPGGFTAGSGTLFATAMAAAGLDNYAARAGLAGYGFLPIERIVAAPPDLLVVDADPGRAPSLADRMLAHPALRRSVPDGARVKVGSAFWSCGGPFTAEAVTRLAEARTRLLTAAPAEGH